MRLLSIALFFLLALSATCQIELTEEEKKQIRKANTARIRPVIRQNLKEFIKLMNLLRVDPELLGKYVEWKYDAERSKKVQSFAHARKREIPLLKPATKLQLSGWLHAFISGMIASEGHQALAFRNAFFLNIAGFLPRNSYGENCEYGSYKAIDVFISLLNSSAHRANMLNREYYRVGIAQFPHWEFRWNTVTVFMGRKLPGHLRYNKKPKSNSVKQPRGPKR